MGLRTKTVTLASVMAGVALFSQAPEFAQQYRQRIGGAVDELKTVVVDFDTDAEASQLSSKQALDQLTGADAQFSRDRGESMTRTIGRFETLSTQQIWLENSHPFTRPLLVLKSPDSVLINRAWEIYEPAVPLNMPGAVYGGIGALLALLLARLGIGGARRMRRNPVVEKDVPTVENPEATMADNPTDMSVPPPGQSGRNGIPEAMKTTPAQVRNLQYLHADKGGAHEGTGVKNDQTK